MAVGFANAFARAPGAGDAARLQRILRQPHQGDEATCTTTTTTTATTAPLNKLSSTEQQQQQHPVTSATATTTTTTTTCSGSTDADTNVAADTNDAKTAQARPTSGPRNLLTCKVKSTTKH